MPDGFSVRIFNALRMIPSGRVSTYSDLAGYAATKKHARAAASVLKKNPDPPHIPCHRIVRKDASLGGYSAPGGVRRKKELLMKEGIQIRGGRVSDFEKVRYVFPSDRMRNND